MEEARINVLNMKAFFNLYLRSIISIEFYCFIKNIFGSTIFYEFVKSNLGLS